jgi:hydrogenase nickel incorporation protein HypA/HybF
MHEVSVMSSILEQVLAELKKYDVVSVKELELVVGELTFLSYDPLRFAYEIMTRGTPLEGAELKMIPEEIEVQCPSCGYRGRVDYLEDEAYHFSVPVLHCPKCDSKVEVIRGKRCGVTSMKVIER